MAANHENALPLRKVIKGGNKMKMYEEQKMD